MNRPGCIAHAAHLGRVPSTNTVFVGNECPNCNQVICILNRAQLFRRKCTVRSDGCELLIGGIGAWRNDSAPRPNVFAPPTRRRVTRSNTSLDICCVSTPKELVTGRRIQRRRPAVIDQTHIPRKRRSSGVILIVFPEYGRQGPSYDVGPLLFSELIAEILPLAVRHHGIRNSGQTHSKPKTTLPWPPRPHSNPPWSAIVVSIVGGISGIGGAVIGRRGLPWSGFAMVLGVILWTYGFWIVLPWSVQAL